MSAVRDSTGTRIVVTVGQSGDVAAAYLRHVADQLAEGVTGERHGEEFSWSVETCACARHDDGSVTTMLCPTHADVDPCLTMAQVTGRRRVGSIVRGTCTSCGHGGTR